MRLLKKIGKASLITLGAAAVVYTIYLGDQREALRETLQDYDQQEYSLRPSSRGRNQHVCEPLTNNTLPSHGSELPTLEQYLLPYLHE